MIRQDLDRLLALREIDLGLDDLLRREADLQARLREGQQLLASLKNSTEIERRALDELLKQHKILDLDLKQWEEKVKKYTSQMYEVKTNKEYSALKEEIDKGKLESQRIEDEILALMMREDEMKGAIGRRKTELAEMEKNNGDLEAEVKAGLEKCATERSDFTERRKAAAEALSAALLRRYEQIRKLRGGSPLAKVTSAAGEGVGVCGECHMTVRPQTVVELYKQEELVPCESCGRILYLDVESSSISQNA